MKNNERSSDFRRAIGINMYRDSLSGKSGEVLSLIDAMDEVMENALVSGVVMHDGYSEKNEDINLDNIDFIRYKDSETLEVVPNSEAKDKLLDIRLASMFVLEAGKNLSVSKTNKYSFILDHPVVMVAFCNSAEGALKLQKKLTFK